MAHRQTATHSNTPAPTNRFSKVTKAKYLEEKKTFFLTRAKALNTDLRHQSQESFFGEEKPFTGHAVSIRSIERHIPTHQQTGPATPMYR